MRTKIMKNKSNFQPKQSRKLPSGKTASSQIYRITEYIKYIAVSVL